MRDLCRWSESRPHARPHWHEAAATVHRRPHGGICSCVWGLRPGTANAHLWPSPARGRASDRDHPHRARDEDHTPRARPVRELSTRAEDFGDVRSCHATFPKRRTFTATVVERLGDAGNVTPAQSIGGFTAGWLALALHSSRTSSFRRPVVPLLGGPQRPPRGRAWCIASRPSRAPVRRTLRGHASPRRAGLRGRLRRAAQRLPSRA